MINHVHLIEKLSYIPIKMCLITKSIAEGRQFISETEMNLPFTAFQYRISTL